MKQFYFFLLLVTAWGNYAQENNYNSNIFTDSPITLSSGHYSFNLPLFDLETSNDLIRLNALLGYHSKSVRAIYSGSEFGNGFSLNILPVISRQEATDEKKLPSLSIGANGINDKPDVYSYNVLGLSGKFFLYVKDGGIKAQVIEQNQFTQIKIQHDTNTGGLGGGLRTYENMYFILIDKNGTEYVFDIKEQRVVEVTSGGLRPKPSKQNRPHHIYLSRVIDKSKKEILNYSYDNRVINPDLTLKQIKEINILNYGTVKFNFVTPTSKFPYVQSIELFDDIGNLRETIQFMYSTAHKSSWNLSQLTFKSSTTKNYRYGFFYAPYTGTLHENGFYWKGNLYSLQAPYENIKPSTKYRITEFSSPDLLAFTSGALNRIVLPTGGWVDFTYEINQAGIPEDQLYTGNLNNFYLDETSTSTSTVNILENGKFVSYTRKQFSIDEITNIFYKITANGVESGPIIPGPGGGLEPSNPGGTSGGSVPTWIYPRYKIINSANNYTWVNAEAKPGNTYTQLQLQPGTYYVQYKTAEQAQFTQISLRKHYKKNTDLEYFTYAPGIRIKSIKESHNGKIKNETIFHYKPFMQMNEKVSSGYLGKDIVYSQFNLNVFQDKNAEFVYYKNVVKEIKGRGFIEYDYGDRYVNDSLITIGKYDQLRNFPKIIKQYDTGKNITGEISNTYTFDYPVTEVNENEINVKYQGILKKSISEAKEYINGQNSGHLLKTIDFATDVREVASETIRDMKNNETIQSENTFQKLGNEIRIISQKNRKNGHLLYQNQYTYAVHQLSQNHSFYKLASFIQENTFGERTDNFEVTRTDNNGNIIEYKDHLGIYHVIVWGYNTNKKLFEIADMRYDQLNASLVSNLQYITSDRFFYNDQNIPFSNMNFRKTDKILNEYSNLRATYPDKLITTYIYAIGKGISVITDPNERSTYYEYDDFGRLTSIKDQEGNLVKTYQYNLINGVN